MKDIIKIIKYSWSLKWFYNVTMALTIVIAILSQATPFLLKAAVDGIVKVNAGQPVAFTYFGIIIALILISSLAATFLDNLRGYLGDKLSIKLQNYLSQRYYEHVVQLPVGYFDNQITGRITSRLDRGISTIVQLITALVNTFIGLFLTTAITLVIMAYYSWPIAILLAALFPFYTWVTTLSSRAWQKHQEGINKDIDYSNGRFVESISQIRVIKSFVQEHYETKLFKELRTSAETQTNLQSRGWHFYDIIRRIGLNVAFFGIYGFIIWQTYKGHFSLGQMTLLIGLATQAQFPLFASSFIVDQIQRAQAGSKDYFEVMDTKPEITDKRGATDLVITRGEIDYKKVVFAYEKGKRILNDISFTVKPGSKVALVGESGQGKTTLANLLLRFYETTAGEIEIDGQPIKSVSQSSLRSAIGVVFQEPALFSGTVTGNIRYGDPEANEEAIIAAAKAANAHDFITKLPNGYDTEIGERGVKLSGGQKQRIAIARAILKNPPILILDEATSSLDSKAEHEVQAALEVLMKDRTTMIIAHRLSTIQNVDMIVGLLDGKVAEIGSPADLANKKDGIYAELLQLQNPTKANKAKLKKYDIARV